MNSYLAQCIIKMRGRRLEVLSEEWFANEQLRTGTFQTAGLLHLHQRNHATRKERAGAKVIRPRQF